MTKSKRKPGEWWDKSWSVVTGCTPAGAGCDHCWARSLLTRFPAAHVAGFTGLVSTRGMEFSTVRCHPERLDEPLHRRKPTVYAVSLLGDLFHEQVPDSFVDDVISRTELRPGDQAPHRHTFVVLTKRPRRAFRHIVGEHANLIVLASAWDQPSVDAACAALSSVPKLRWGLHLEPLLGPVTLLDPKRCHDLGCAAACNCGHSHNCDGMCWLWTNGPKWIVVGSENGPSARPFDLSWPRSIQEQCAAAGIPYWFKGAHKQEVPDEMVVRQTPFVGREHNEVPW